MPNAVTQTFIPGPRLIDGSDLNTMIGQINSALGGGGTPGAFSTLTSAGLFAAYGATGAASQPAGAAQTAITDGSGGTASPTTGVGNGAAATSVVIPLGLLSGLANSQVFKVAIPFAFTCTAIGFRTGVPATTASKLATLTAQISGVAMTGGVTSLTSANQATTGTLTASTAITALNTGAAGATLEVAVSAVTAFVEGSGWVEATLIDTSLANSLATIVALENAIRSALVTEGLIKGSA